MPQEQEQINDLDKYLSIVQETKSSSMAKITRQSKINRATGQLSSVEARKKHDPLYQRMIYYRDLYFKYREMIHKKYSPRVRSKARR